MLTYFLSLSCWSYLTYIIPSFVVKRPLSITAVLHNISSSILLYYNYNYLVISNTLAYYTNDLMNMIHTNHYSSNKCLVMSFHHILSMILLSSFSINSHMYITMIICFKDIEYSNLALNGYYYSAKYFTNPYILAVLNGGETIIYGYYRIKIIKYFIINYDLVEKHLFESFLFICIYVFGLYFTLVLTYSTFQKCSKLI